MQILQPWEIANNNWKLVKIAKSNLQIVWTRLFSRKSMEKRTIIHAIFINFSFIESNAFSNEFQIRNNQTIYLNKKNWTL